MSPPRDRKQIDVLQAGRALAALAVVVHHSAISAGTFSGSLPAFVRWVASQGYLGIDFFFVLSGFIIYHTRGRSLGRYVRSRFVRVFAPYLPVGLGMAAIYTLLPQLSAGPREWSWLASVTLLPGSGEPALIVAWTLQYELLFYFIFALGVTLGRPAVAVAVWAAAAGAYNLLNGFPEDPPAFFSMLAFQFLFGVLAAKAVEMNLVRWAPIYAVAAFLLFLPVAGSTNGRILFGLAMAFLVIFLTRGEQQGRIVTPGWLLFLGAASYSLYLVHSPIGSLVARFVGGGLLSLAACVAVSVGAGIAYHLVVEAPALRRLKPALPPSGLEGQGQAAAG